MGRLEILKSIDNQISGISKANGYNSTLKKHSSGFFDYINLPRSSFPAVCIATGGSNYTPMTAQKYTSGESIQAIDGWFVSTIGYVKSNTQEKISSDLEPLISDIIKAILSDHHLGLSSYVQNITLKSVSPYLDLQENVGIVEINWAVKYDFEKGSP